MSGDGAFWSPVAEHLALHQAILVDWPGLGSSAPSAAVTSYDDLVSLVLRCIDDRPSVLVAQSMGGYVAVRAALQSPANVTHLVLAATSGGVDIARFGARDWRPESRDAQRSAPDWAFDNVADLTRYLPSITVPVLLLWASRDDISPVRVGQHLESLFPNARLVVFDTDDHWVARVYASEAAHEIQLLLDRRPADVR
jgi:pimeloyl-ACP methyl ester carboxylesterase